jgi:hypothetical protein
MAFVKNNPILAGASGKLGNLVYRQMNGKTIVQCAPVRTAPYNEAQKKQQGRFKEAMAYARTLLADPKVKAEYTARAKARHAGLNAFNLAVSEYLKGGSHNNAPEADSSFKISEIENNVSRIAIRLKKRKPLQRKGFQDCGARRQKVLLYRSFKCHLDVGYPMQR